jgi:hypothetical protein
MNSRKPAKRILSAKAPVISAGVMIANMSWKAMNASEGMVGARPIGFAPTPWSPANLRVPMIPPRSGPKASEYPTSIHRMLTRARAMNDCITVPNTFFARTKPP